MENTLNITSIPAPRVPFIDERTGLMAREWYRFFLNLFILTGSGSNPTTLDELQIGPPNQPDFTELLIQINKDIAPQYEDQSGDFLKTLDTAQLMSMMSRFENAEAAIQGAYLQPAQLPVDGVYVVGPGSSTDNAVARFDGTTGKLIQNSVTTIDDTGNASGILSQQFSDGTAVTLAAGKLWYNGTTGSWNGGMGNGNITQQIGEEIFIYGKASAAITDSPLQIVYKTGVVGASGVITFAPTIASITEADQILGIATESISHNNFGRITTFGIVRAITTNGTAFGEVWADNDDIYYNPVTGNPTKNKPVAPNIKVQLGTIINAGSGGSGSFFVSIGSSSTLGGTDSNVQFGALANNNLIAYDSAVGYWKNVTASSIGLGTVTSVAALTLGTTGTDLSSTVANGTTTPVITLQVPTASASNRGALSAADWTTFNNKGSGTVTSVTGTAPVVSSGGATPAISMAAATTSVNGYLTSTDWTTFNSKQPAGSYLVSGGALGTPSSGTVTNLTGTASININGTVGATTPDAGAFTTLSATGITTVAAGSAALPAIVSTTGTADTGIWFPAADTVAASTAGVEALRIDASGNLLVATTSVIQGGKLSVAGAICSQTAGAGFSANLTTTTGDQFYFRTDSGANLAGYITSPTSSTTQYLSISDYRLKDNVAPMSGALGLVLKLKPVTYTWKSDGANGQGFIAHELQAVVPDCVGGTKDAVDAEGNPKYQGIDTSFLVATLTAAIQELKIIVDTQAVKIAALENK